MRNLWLALLLISSGVFAAPGDLICAIDFENNSLNPASCPIGPGKRVGPPTVSTNYAVSGTHSARLVYDDELGYELDSSVASITIEYWLRVPNNYAANRNYPGTFGPNNKFIRIYGSDDYTSNEKIGLSTYEPASDPSNTYPVDELVPEWHNIGDGQGSVGTQGTGTYYHWQASEEGTWKKYKVFYAPPTSSSPGGYGTLKVWVNDTLRIDETGTVNTWDAAAAHNVKFFYLLGAANSGWSVETPFYIDDVSIWEGEPVTSNTMSGAWTDGADTVAGTGTLGLAGSAAIIDSVADALSGTGKLALTGGGAISDNVPDILSGSIAAPVAAQSSDFGKPSRAPARTLTRPLGRSIGR